MELKTRDKEAVIFFINDNEFQKGTIEGISVTVLPGNNEAVIVYSIYDSKDNHEGKLINHEDCYDTLDELIAGHIKRYQDYEQSLQEPEYDDEIEQREDVAEFQE